MTIKQDAENNAAFVSTGSKNPPWPRDKDEREKQLGRQGK